MWGHVSSRKSSQDLIGQAKAAPGTIYYESSGSGGAPHLATVKLFKTDRLKSSSLTPMAQVLSLATREKLKNVSVATLCTASFKRGLRNQFIQEVLKGRSIVGLYPPTQEQANIDFVAWRQARGR